MHSPHEEKNRAVQCSRRCGACIAIFISLFGLAPGLSAAATLLLSGFAFERMWPTLPQPWYFTDPWGLAVSRDGYVYVCDSLNYRVQKLAADGRVLKTWGRFGDGAGEFSYPGPGWIAVDDDDDVYVVDRGNHRVQKFSPDGDFLSTWGAFGTGPGEFNRPEGIAVDQLGFVYVVDSGNHRVQKFTSDGEFVTEWGSHGAGPQEFQSPIGIAVSKGGVIYVTDGGDLDPDLVLCSDLGDGPCILN